MVKVIVCIICPAFSNFSFNREPKQILNPDSQICPPADMGIGDIISFLSVLAYVH